MLRISMRSSCSLHQTPLREGSRVIQSPVQPSCVGYYPQLLFQRSCQGFFFSLKKQKTSLTWRHVRIQNLPTGFQTTLQGHSFHLSLFRPHWPSGCWNWDLPEKAQGVLWTTAPDFLLLEVDTVLLALVSGMGIQTEIHKSKFHLFRSTSFQNL